MTNIPDTQELVKACPECGENNLQAKFWGEFEKSVEFRITCMDVSCSYEPFLITELKENLENGKLVRVHILPERSE